ncbi:hypothetical protein [Synechococcus sp. UW140]|uniref:hypothetical protein n=1 Tax=Synechococcus sp. UW140 TaxID=368503 RepID=UPI003137C393
MAFYISAPFFQPSKFLLSTSSLSLYWLTIPIVLIVTLKLYQYFFPLKIRQKSFASIFPREISLWLVIPFFFVSLIQLYLYPWHSTFARDSHFGTISALVRFIWLALAPLSLNSSAKSTNILYLILSGILSLVDGSRSVFFICFLISISKFFYSKVKIFLILLFLVFFLLVIAAVRSGWDIYGFTNGLVGEQTLSTMTFLNTLNFSFSDPEKFHQFIYLISIPIIFPFVKILNYFVDDFAHLDVMNQYSYFQEMGGGFIGTHFVPLGSLSVILLPLYMIITLYITNLLLSWYSPLISCFVPILFVKTSPYVYWNFVYMLAFFLFIFSLLIRSSFFNKIFKPIAGNSYEPFSTF